MPIYRGFGGFIQMMRKISDEYGLTFLNIKF